MNLTAALASRALSTVSLATLLCAALAGCASASEPVGGPAPMSSQVPTAPSDGGPGAISFQAGAFFFDSARTTEWAEGANTGILTDSAGCLTLDNGSIPIFPSTLTTWAPHTLTYLGQTYAVGDRITLGGGELKRENADFAVPAECGAGDLWIVSLA